jgi:hypothetical protein
MTQLKNGATVIESTTIGKDTIVLAKTSGYHPFVTWRVDAEGNAYWGHYFAHKEEAEEDFIDRVKGLSIWLELAA